MGDGENQAQFYIGVKQVKAYPSSKDDVPGYAVIYPDGYQSWCPKDVFERAYLPMGEGNDGTKITEAMVDAFMGSGAAEIAKLGPKTTVVQVELPNGFILTETSSCVDPANYDHTIGVHVCHKRIRDKVWGYLGFLLQTARGGVARR